MPNRQWSHGSLRHKYSDLIELQQKADVLLNEFYSTKDLLDEKKAERKKNLKNCNQFLQDLQNIPNFPESIDYFTKPDVALKVRHIYERNLNYFYYEFIFYRIKR